MARAEGEGREAGLPLHVERADAFRRVDLVARDREQVDAERANVDGDLPDRLRSVGVHQRAARMSELRQLGDGLDHAGLVVRMHHRDQSGVTVDRRARLVQAHPAVGVHPETGHPMPVVLEPGARPRGGRMLDGARHDVPALLVRRGHAANGEVVGFGAPRREHHLVRLAAEQVGHARPGAGDGIASRHAVGVPARRIAEVLAQVRDHGVDDLRQDRCRRVVVEVDEFRLAHDGSSRITACAGACLTRRRATRRSRRRRRPARSGRCTPPSSASSRSSGRRWRGVRPARTRRRSRRCR